MKAEVGQIKKLNNGKLAVQWKGQGKKFYLIPDDEIAQYMAYLIVTPKEQVEQNQKSRLR